MAGKTAQFVSDSKLVLDRRRDAEISIQVTMGYSHKNSKGQQYFLHSKEVALKGAKHQVIYYFAREVDPSFTLDAVPADKVVSENVQTGLPLLKDKEMLLSDIAQVVFRQFWDILISNIASAPDFIYEIAWLDLERMLAQVFEGLGFQVHLTPSAKDGGKDIVLTFDENGVKRTFFVKVKHWKSKRVGSNHFEKFVKVVVNAGHCKCRT